MNRREFLSSSLAAALAGSSIRGMSQRGSGSVPNSPRRILYVMADLTETNPARQRTLVDTLGSSGFNVLILSFLEASMGGGKLSLLYNDNAVASLAPRVPALLAQLRAGFAARKRIQISIGGWGHTPTFGAIRSVGVPAFVRQLTEEIIAPLGLDGIDIDLEPQQGGLENWIGVHRDYGKTIVDLTNEYKRVHPTHLVTHAPISPVAAEMYVKAMSVEGRKISLLEGTRTPRGNNVDWLNVQFYEGGVVVEGTIADYYRTQLAGPLSTTPDQFGISQPLHFLTPTFEPQAKQPLEFCQQTIAAINQSCADLQAGKLNGVALWDYRQVAPDINGWSRGLEAAFPG